MSEPQEPAAPQPTPRSEYVSPALSRLAGGRRSRSPVRQIVESGAAAAPRLPDWLLEMEARDRLDALDRQLRRAERQLARQARRQALAERLERLARELGQED